MRAVDLIYNKRMGGTLDADEIRWLISEYAKGRVPDYQLSAWLMAVCFRGLGDDELAALTDAMMRSGEVYDFSKIPGPKVDKHSTGGVGDKVSLILAPLAAACGLIVPMIAGRGLGHTGGTIDKLEAIPGFNVNLDRKKLRRQLANIGVAIGAQTARFVPADKKLYALRDVTATVESIPLIAASIMSKKLAEGAEGLVLDIKVGNGAFMPDAKNARRLAATMIGIGRAMGRRVQALLTDMNQPTGHAVGNANEVAEAIQCLKGIWPEDLKTITLALTARMLLLGGIAKNEADARARMARALAGGAALERFGKMIAAQGGDPRVIENTKLLPGAPREAVIAAPRAGWIAGFDTRRIGVAAALLGAGRAAAADSIDHGVGLFAPLKIGDPVSQGDPVFTVRYRKTGAWQAASPILENAYRIAEEKIRRPRLILENLKDDDSSK